MEAVLHHQQYDVVVIGGGCAGVAAAAGAARNGVRTLLVDAGPTVGGELLSGMTIDGAINARGEWIVGGVLNELIEELEKLDGYVGAFNDWRLIRYICFDPVVMQIAVMNVLRRYGVDVLLHTMMENVILDGGGRAKGVVLRNKRGRAVVEAAAFVDCSGDGDLCAMAGAPFELGTPDGELQPVSLIFRMSGVEPMPLLAFVREHPDYVAIGESEVIRGGRTDEEIVEELYKQGQPTVFLRRSRRGCRKASK
ncbi:FAD-dependent oxidoreductase [Paenibacillus sp. GYB003]|uniref:FAD-dependent oxidoreductase n=1 Tax=Paenibacillus sp. GYB003 TaxID=2994392 RepID=UPI002F96CB96